MLSPLFFLLRLLFSAAGQSCGPELCCWWCWLFYPTFSVSWRCSVGKNNRLFFQRRHSTLRCFSTKTQQAARSAIIFFLFYTTGLSAEQHRTPSEKLHWAPAYRGASAVPHPRSVAALQHPREKKQQPKFTEILPAAVCSHMAIYGGIAGKKKKAQPQDLAALGREGKQGPRCGRRLAAIQQGRRMLLLSLLTAASPAQLEPSQAGPRSAETLRRRSSMGVVQPFLPPTLHGGTGTAFWGTLVTRSWPKGIAESPVNAAVSRQPAAQSCFQAALPCQTRLCSSTRALAMHRLHCLFYTDPPE